MNPRRLRQLPPLVLLAGYALLPLLWLARLSVTPEIEMHRWPPTLWPAHITFAYYGEILGQAIFWRQLANSLLVCLPATLVALALGALGAYGLTRHRFRYRDAVLLGGLALHLAPGAANMTAIYRVAENLHAFDSLPFVAILKTGGVILAMWTLTATFQNVPARLEQAARLDGLSRPLIFWRVTLPLAWPGIFATGLLLFIQSWNSFFLPFLLLEDPRKMTLTVGLYRYFSEHGFEQGHVAAYLIVSILPVLALFALFRRRLWSHLAN